MNSPSANGSTPLPREILVAKLKRARATRADIERQPRANIAAVAWQRGYAKAVEEMLDVQGISLRRYPRHPTGVTADVRRLAEDPMTGTQWGKGTMTDLSRGGCGLATWLPLSPGDWVEMSFALPEPRTPLWREGRVRRTQQMGDKVVAGLEFAEELPDWP